MTTIIVGREEVDHVPRAQQSCDQRGATDYMGICHDTCADVIKEAKRQRKVLGGGWRQGGMLAAAGKQPVD